MKTGDVIRFRPRVGRGYFTGRVTKVREDGTLEVARYARMARGGGEYTVPTFVNPARVIRVIQEA